MVSGNCKGLFLILNCFLNNSVNGLIKLIVIHSLADGRFSLHSPVILCNLDIADYFLPELLIAIVGQINCFKDLLNIFVFAFGDLFRIEKAVDDLELLHDLPR